MWDKVERAAQGVLAFVGGGWAMLWYLDATLSPSVNQIHRLLMIAPTFCMPIMIIVSFVQWKVRKPLKEPIEPSAARSGASVIIMVGLAAAISTYGGVNTAQDLYLPALILFATVVVTVLVIRFAHRNEGNIGEARFRTMPRK